MSTVTTVPAVTTNAPVTHLPDGTGTRLWVAGFLHTIKATREDTNGAFSVIEVTVPAQGGPPPHVHRREDEVLYVLDGEFTFLAGDRVLDAGPGSYVHIPPGTLHRFENVGTTAGRLLAFFTPAGFEGFFSEVGQPAVEGSVAPPLGPDEIERTLAVAEKYGMVVPVGPGPAGP